MVEEGVFVANIHMTYDEFHAFQIVKDDDQYQAIHPEMEFAALEQSRPWAQTTRARACSGTSTASRPGPALRSVSTSWQQTGARSSHGRRVTPLAGSLLRR